MSYILTERREVLTARLNVEIVWNFFCENLKSGCVVYLLDESDQAFSKKKIVRNGATPWVLYHCVTTAAVCG